MTTAGTHGTGGAHPSRVVLTMYPFEELRAGYQALWDAVAASAGVAGGFEWPADAEASWTDPDLLLGQACGWPLVQRLRSDVRVLGAFEHRLGAGEPTGPWYRSVVLARSTIEGPLTDVLPTLRAAVNSPESLSGWVSLLVAAGRRTGGWPGGVEWTGSHIGSIAALRTGLADVASIDAVTLHHVGRRDHALVDGLVVVGRGPLVPTLPVITSASTPPPVVDALVAGLRRSVHELQGANGFAALDIGEFHPIGADAYAALHDLVAGASPDFP